jgi:predicted ATPase
VKLSTDRADRRNALSREISREHQDRVILERIGHDRVSVRTGRDRRHLAPADDHHQQFVRSHERDSRPRTYNRAENALAQAVGEDHLATAVAERNLLLVLDNMEHLLEGVPLLSRLLSAAPALRILATSRTALRLSGEHIVRVPPLSLPGDNPAAPPQDSEAVRLFAARAEAVSPGFADQPGDVPAIAAICTCLDGLPLAIELAAARVRLWPPQVLLPMLQSRLQLLTGGPRDQPPANRPCGRHWTGATGC